MLNRDIESYFEEILQGESLEMFLEYRRRLEELEKESEIKYAQNWTLDMKRSHRRHIQRQVIVMMCAFIFALSVFYLVFKLVESLL